MKILFCPKNSQVILIASLFTDPSILPKYFGISPVIYLSILLIYLASIIGLDLLKQKKFIVDRRVFWLGFIFMQYALLSVAYRIYAGQQAPDLGLHILMIATIFYSIIVLSRKDLHESIRVAFYIAGLMHFISLFQDPFGFRDNLLSATAYEFGAGGLNDFSRRETGLFPSPALLVAFANALFVISYIDYLSAQHKKRAVIGILLSLFLGLSTYNRSFVLIVTVSTFIILFANGINLKHIVLFSFAIIFALVFPLGNYLDFIIPRFESIFENGLDATQRWNGNTGIVAGLEVFLDYPLFGSPVSPGGGIMNALSKQGDIVLAHNGLIQILSVYGLFGGIALLIIYALSYLRAILEILKYRIKLKKLSNLNEDEKMVVSSSTISVSIMLLLSIEPLSEYGLILLLSMLPLIVRIQFSKNNS